MQGVRKATLVAALIVLGAGHVAYWYWPREHPGALRRGSSTAAVLAASDLPLRAWIAYPHQNLAFLATAERGDSWRRGLADLAGLPAIELPRFGPFRLPPASELAVATDGAGKRLLVAARVYPLISWVARAAGRIAGNPWLSGGVVEDGGRELLVEWQGRMWILRTAGEDRVQPLPAGEAVDGRKVLAWLALGGAVGPLPAGRYEFARQGPHLDLRSLGAAAGPLAEPAAGVLLMTERRSAGFRASAILGPGQGSLRGLPSAVTLAQDGVEAPALPFERLYSLLGIKRQRARVGGWELVASDRLALGRGRELLPEVENAVSVDGLALAYSVDLDVVRAVSDDLEKKLRGLPLPATREVRQWRGAALILAELRAYRRWTLEVTENGEARSRLWRDN
jgi:hypothetical protein